MSRYFASHPRKGVTAAAIQSQPRAVNAVQGAVASPYVWVTWDRNDRTATKYEVLRNDGVVSTIGPFVPFDPANSAHRDWTSSPTYVSTVLADSPRYLFRLEQDASSQTDSGSNLLTASTESAGVQTALPSTTGAITGLTANKARVFDGVDDRMIINNNAQLDVFAGAWSIEFWIKRGDINRQQEIWRRGTNVPTLIIDADNTLRVRQFGVADIVKSTAGITDTTAWHHVAVTCAGSTSLPKIYFDGADRTGTQINAPTFGNTSSFINIGGSSSGTQWFNGSLDEQALYPVQLSAAQVLAHYNASTAVDTPATQPFDDTWNKCSYKDTTVVAGQTYTYQVRAYVGAATAAPNTGASVKVMGDADYGPVRQVAAPSGGDDTSVLQAAITTAQADRGIAVLQSGTYRFTNLSFTSAEMILRMQSDTILKAFGAGGATPGSGAVVQLSIDGGSTTVGALSTAITVGQRTATFSNTSGFSVGSMLTFTAPSIGGTLLESYARGDVIKPGEMYSEYSRWEANEVTAINGSTVTFRNLFTQQIPTTATVARLGEPTVGQRRRGLVIESGTIEGVSSTDATFFTQVYIQNAAGVRLAGLRGRWANGNFVSAARASGVRLVECEEPDHGGASEATNTTSRYSIDMVRVANLSIIACTLGDSAADRILSPVVIQRCPRTLVRSLTAHRPKNYGFNEHGGASEQWVAENCWFNLRTTTVYGGAFLGNPDWAFSGQGILRNIRQDSGPIGVYCRENTYGIRVLDYQAYSLVSNPNSLSASLVVWGGLDSPHDNSSNWGSAKLTVRGCGLFGSSHRGMWLGRRNSNYFGVSGDAANPDPAGDGYGYTGIRDVIIEDTHLGGVSTTRMLIEGTNAQSGRIQVRNVTGSGSDTRPTLQAGDHWINNGDGVTFGTATTVPWSNDIFET